MTFTPTIELGALEIDILNRIVRAGSSALRLTSLEQSLLYLLAANVGRVVTREEIPDTLLGVDYVVESKVVDRLIRNLRARLQHDPGQRPSIATVPGRGYRFLPTPSADTAQEAPQDADTLWLTEARPVESRHAQSGRAGSPPAHRPRAQPSTN